jgi:hypothetical protein
LALLAIVARRMPALMSSSDSLLALEVALHHRVVDVGQRLEQLLPVLVAWSSMSAGISSTA